MIERGEKHEPGALILFPASPGDSDGLFGCFVTTACYRLMDESGMLVVECPAVPGCISEWRTEAEALENIREAIAGCLATRAL